MKRIYVYAGAEISSRDYSDFRVGERANFALEFYSKSSLLPSSERNILAEHLKCAFYKVCGKVVYRTKQVWVIDIGFLLFRLETPPDFAIKDSWVEGEICVSIAPDYYLEYLKKSLSDMPELACEFLIEQTMIDTTPLITVIDPVDNSEYWIGDETKISFREVKSARDTFDDINGNGYILKCLRIN